ncbi:collagen-like triple helix repeat-containing protein [Streptomyces marincola]|uniref:collagen-like triple helix repeat-containing protein n=1 Tax=Streptomyces marincola TaxID=2878388 RepID=UPI001CF5D600|nr:collagen-like protein [Streptomyces marincola]UCM88536.1 collagen-like protein [Streptomyces marincola]
MSQPPPPPQNPPGPPQPEPGGGPAPAPGSPAPAPAPGSPAPAPGTPASAPGGPAPAPGTPASAPGGPAPAPGTPASAPPAVPGGLPGQPGYGYPQQAYGSPQQGYGFPQSPGAAPYPSPYQQPGLPGQPGPAAPGGAFGAPTAPGPYGPATGGFATPPPGPAGPRGRGRRGVVLAAVAAFAVLVGGGGAVWLLTGGNGDSPAQAAGDGADDGAEGGARGEAGNGTGLPLPTEAIDASLAWEVPAPEVSEEENIIDAKGTWLTEDAFVRVTPDSLVSYDLATGQENWSLPFEFSGGGCLPSSNVSDHRVALLQGRDCEVLTVVDIAAGTEVMSMQIESEWPTSAGSVPAILGDTVAVGTGVAGLGFSISRQEMIWQPPANSDCRESAYTVVDDMFVSQLSCGFAGDEGGSIRATDESGDTELWEWAYGPTYEGEPFEVQSVVSVDPLVVTATVGEDYTAADHARVLVIDENHEEVAGELDYDQDRYLRPCETNSFDNCWLGVEHEGFLYLPSNVPYGDNAVEAFDLSTGQPLWEVPAINGGQILPFGVQDGQILAYQVASAELEGMVVAIDPATEEVRPIMALDRAARPQEHALMSGIFVHDQHIIWRDNTLVLANRSFYSSDGADVRSVLVYR